MRDLQDIAWLFLRLGLTAFGGPAAHVAKMNDEIVYKRQWLTNADFLDLFSAANLIPGPNSTELAIHIGYRRAGWTGLLVAGASFILPAAVMVSAIAWAYVRFGKLPVVSGILYGVKPVIIAIIAQALWRFARTICTGTRPILWTTVAIVLIVLGVNELLVLGLCAAFGLVSSKNRPAAGVSAMLFAIPATSGGAAPITLLSLFLSFLKIGAVLFGSGYVLVAFLRTDFVERFHWLTEQQLLDAVAVGQITPGPVFTTATFIGYLLLGWTGAAIATVGIFLPAFCFVALTAPMMGRLRSSPLLRRTLDGVNAASLALMAVVTVQLARGALVDLATSFIGITALTLLFLLPRFRSDWLVLCAALFGGIRQLYFR